MAPTSVVATAAVKAVIAVIRQVLDQRSGDLGPASVVVRRDAVDDEQRATIVNLVVVHPVIPARTSSSLRAVPAAISSAV